MTNKEIIAWLEQNIVRMLDNISNHTQCKGCGVDIWFVKHSSGKKAPYTVQALNHFIDCPKSKDFKRNKK